MSKWDVPVMTESGRKLMAKVMAGECRLEFEKAVIGEGEYSDEEKKRLSGQTGLKAPRNQYGFSSIISGEDCVLLKVALDNEDVDSAYYIREMGIYAKEAGSEEPVLAFLCLAKEADYFPNSSSRYTIIHGIQILINGRNLEVAISENMGVYALADDLMKISGNLSDSINKNKEEMDSHKKDGLAHITDEEREKWNTVSNKAEENHTHDNRYYTEDEMDTKLSGKADKADLNNHTGDTTVHVTDSERTNWDDANLKKHEHGNKSILDTITQAILDKCNAAYSHISDTVKHITSAERTLWNTVSNKCANDDSRLSNAREPYFANNKFYNIGDDVAIGDHDVAGTLCVKGLNGTPGIKLYDSSGNAYADVYHSRNLPAYPTSLPASDVYSWAKASSKPSYSWSEIIGKPGTFTPSSHTHDDRYYTESEVDTKLSGKADTADLSSHTGDTTVHITENERTNWNDANSKKHAHSNKSVLDGIASSGKALTAYLKNNASMGTAVSKMALVSYTGSPNYSSYLSISGNGIKCAKSGAVLVYAKANFYTYNGVYASNALRIYKNSSEITNSGQSLVNNCGHTWVSDVTVGPFALNVSAGDIIYMYANASVSNGSGINGGLGNTCMTVKYLS